MTEPLATTSTATRRRPCRTAALALATTLGLPAQDSERLITLNVRDESIANVLQALSTQHRLSLVANEKVAGKVTINLYDVPLDDALRQILATQDLDFVKEGSFYRVVTLEQRKALRLEQDTIGSRVFVLNHLTTAEAQKLLQPLLSPDGRFAAAEAAQATTGATGQTTASSGLRQSIVVQDRASVLTTLATTIEQLDRPPQQVLLEATILSIDLGEDNRLGVDLNVLGGIDFNQVGATSDLTGITGYTANGSQFDDHLISGQTFGFAGSPISQGLSLGFVQNNVAAFVEALEQTTNATIVSNPRVIALNGEQAEIIVGGRLGYTTVTQTQTSSIETVEFLETGTQLVFRPYVGEDGWIRMEVHPQNSAGVIDPVSGVPSENTTEITTKILMRDGQTLILGGLIGESVTTVRSQIPILGNLPILGSLFGRTLETVNRRELVILLTPHILDPVQAQNRADAAKQRFAAVRKSHWDSLSPYIRPVLAKGHLADAVVWQARGDLDRALGSVERALALNPTEADAAMLREALVEALALQKLPTDEMAASLSVLESMTPDAGGR